VWCDTPTQTKTAVFAVGEVIERRPSACPICRTRPCPGCGGWRRVARRPPRNRAGGPRVFIRGQGSESWARGMGVWFHRRLDSCGRASVVVVSADGLEADIQSADRAACEGQAVCAWR